MIAHILSYTFSADRDRQSIANLCISDALISAQKHFPQSSPINRIMTTKLKRKLENIGIDVRSNSTRLTENFCLIGTPLPPLEKSKDTGEFVPLWKQDVFLPLTLVVRDEKGRRRLHGAFTGGFSAGYFNTVGSKEGWTPATFISSRADRAKAKQARPEDFMDEEDIAELKESRKLVDTTEEHDMFADTRAELASRGGGAGAEKDSMAATLQSLLPAAKDSIGARLLKKMGWKAGQGIGPRITYQQLRAQEGNPIQPNEPIDEEATKHLYAPRDTRVAFIPKKDNSFGLGYAPGDGLTNLVHGGAGSGARGSGAGINVESGPNISAGFGLGALNEAEDDDIDVYDRSGGGSKMHRHMAYDAGEEDETDDHIVIGPRFPAKPTSQNVVGSGTFKDGRPVASGFVVSEVPLIENRWFPLPEIPKGWVPDPRRVWAKDPSTATKQEGGPSNLPLPSSGAPDRRPWIKSKTADERGAMLGETPLPSAPRSVFDYLSQKDKDRLKNMGASIASGTAFPKTAPQPQMNSSVDIPTLTPQIAQAAMKGFQPFSKDPEKHARYTVYLQSQSTPDTAPALRPMPGQSPDEFNKELADYVKSAQIFKPVSGAMASRFASSATVEVVGVQHPGLYQPTQEDYAKIDVAKNEDKKKEEEEDPKKHAARLNMFGHLTREEKVWLPARLLLKRFGVRDPYPDGVPGEEPPTSSASTSAAKNDAWQTEVLKVAPELTIPSSTDITSGSSSKPLQRDLANIGLGDDEEQGKDTLTYERPAMDIFKAIFASDDEDSEDDGDEEEVVVKGKEEPIGDNDEEPLTEPPAATSAPPISQHLATTTTTTTSLTTYEPAVNKENTGKVDLSTFKPTFVPLSERGDKKRGEDKERRDKKTNKKKKGKIVVSFDVEEDGNEASLGSPTVVKSHKKERPPKRIKDKAVDAELEDESMWVEKPPPEVVKDLVLPMLTDPVPEDITSTHPRGRKRAVDFI
ncbi:hypothetical protein Clacol_005419 [Clathrus columnatus]|uniref:G-patch domain-containing protein n=1 Tax=Clathrus columnatus TaxID=1419009 RepID=A0AAV5AC72_9AGAM|nr:hypothetical protein Clacol_005419 [Clathrus columnatus]